MNSVQYKKRVQKGTYKKKTVFIELVCTCIHVPFCFLALFRMMVIKTVVKAMIKMRMTPAAVLLVVIVMLFGSGGKWVVPLVK